MTAVINTNMASLYAQKSLSTAQTELASSAQRLSSGRRINSAKDDAAGYAVSQGIGSTKNIADQSVRNVQDAISTVQIAEGALEVVSKMLQRVLVLSVQKENGSLTSSQKLSMNNEIANLLNEVNSIKKRTELQNTQGTIFGSNMSFSTGNGSTVDVSIAGLSLGGAGTRPVSGPLVPGQTYNLRVENPLVYNGNFSYFNQSPGQEWGNASILNGIITFTPPRAGFTTPEGSEIAVNPTPEFGQLYQAINVEDSSVARVDDIINGLTFNGRQVKVKSIVDSRTIVTDVTKRFTDLNPLNIGGGGTTVSFGSSASQRADTNLPSETVYFDNRNSIVEVGGYVTGAPSVPPGYPKIIATGTWYATYEPTTLDLGNPSVYYLLKIASLPAASTGGLGLVADNGFSESATHNAGMILNTDYFDSSGNIQTLTGASVSFISAASITSAIEKNSSNYANLGSQLNRLDYIVDNLQTLSNNLADAQSRILDTNYAAETATLTRGQIMQQATTSMLAQANQMPNVILTLIK